MLGRSTGSLRGLLVTSAYCLLMSVLSESPLTYKKSRCILEADIFCCLLAASGGAGGGGGAAAAAAAAASDAKNAAAAAAAAAGELILLPQ